MSRHEGACGRKDYAAQFGSQFGTQFLSDLSAPITKGNLRIGDVEREEAQRALGEHFAHGRLTREEYDYRSDQVLVARTWSDVSPLFGDLPRPRPGAPERPTSARAAWHGRRHRPRFLPVVLIGIGLAALFHAWWLVPIVIGMFLLLRRPRR